MNAWEKRVSASIENDLKVGTESDAVQALNELVAVKRAKLAALKEMAEVDAEAKAQGIDLTVDPFADFRD